MLAAWLPVQARALDPDRSLAELRHTSWTLRDGAPGNVRALAQGRDGFLWLGTATGLYRFDGLRFERIVAERDDPKRSLQVTALLAADNGDIWVGYDFGGIAIYRGGRLRAANPWPPSGGVSGIVQARDGSVWVAAEARGRMLLARHHAGRWTRYGPQHGLLDGLMGPIHASRDGGLVLALPPALLRLTPAAARLARMSGTAAPFAAIAQGPAGELWLADDNGLRRLGTAPALARLAQVGTPYVTRHMLVDRDGSFWITGQDDGLVRLRRSDGRSRLIGETVAELSARLTLSVLEDREGNVWIGTAAGLDRYAPASMVALAGAAQPVTGFVSAAGSDGIFYAGLQGVYRIGRSDAPPRLVFRQRDIGVLCGTPRRMLAISLEGAFLLDVRTDGTLARSRPVTGPLAVSCAQDRGGTFWTGLDRLHRLRGHRLVPAGAPGGTYNLLRPDAAGGLIAARSRAGLLRWQDGHERVLLPTDRLAIGSVTTLLQDGQRLLVGGQKGLALIAGDTLAQLSERQYPALAGLTGIHRTADGWTWLIGALGVVRVRSATLDQVFATPGSPLPVQRIGQEGDHRARSNLFDASDIAADAWGRLWFATDSGVAWVDPARLSVNAVVPPVTIRSLLVDGVPRAPSGTPIRLPPNVGRVEIDYTALSLTDAGANRFRYRLLGASDEWYEAGGERRALFTNLGPGSYTFQVMAANNAGRWNPQPASLTFAVAPAFYQARWFYILCAAAVCGAGWLLYRRRLQIIAERARGRVEAQLAERERIARELHDTLLQGFQGLMLRFQAVVELLPHGHRARDEMEHALDRAEDVLVEGRERVHSIREELLPVPLPDRLAALADDILPASIDWQVETEGTPALVCAPVAEEIAIIVREALSNAIRHAQARAIVVRIRFTNDRILVSVIDNGVGMPGYVRQEGRRQGHYGMIGMRERAQRLLGSLEFLMPATGGTEVRLTIPTHIAYQGTARA